MPKVESLIDYVVNQGDPKDEQYRVWVASWFTSMAYITGVPNVQIQDEATALNMAGDCWEVYCRARDMGFKSENET